jgi:HEAT repeats
VPDRRLNFEQLRNQARELLRQFRAGDPEALARWDAQFGRRPNVLRLAHAQVVLAREAGLPSWPRLKAYLEAPRFVRRPRGPKKLPSFSRLEELYAYTLGLVKGNDPAALALEMPPGGWYGRTTAVLLREMFVERGTLDSVTSLIAKGLKHQNAKVRYECAHLLDSFGDERCVQTLTRLLEDPVPRVRAIALHSLVCDACKLAPLHSRPDLVALTIDWATNDPHRRVKQEARRVLAESNEPKASAALRKLGVKRRAPAVRRSIPRRLPGTLLIRSLLHVPKTPRLVRHNGTSAASARSGGME